MDREAIILAGGLGTRLSHLIPDLPKPMAPVSGKPFLTYLLDQLIHNHFTHVILSVGYKAEKISNCFGTSYGPLKLSYSIEELPLGTGGAIKQSVGLGLSNSIFVLNGDTFFDIDFDKMEQQHNETQSALTMAVKPLSNYCRYGTVQFNEQRITGFLEKRAMDAGHINGGIYLLNQNQLPISSWPESFSFEQCFLEQEYEHFLFCPYISDTYFIDIGIPEDFAKADLDFKSRRL